MILLAVLSFYRAGDAFFAAHWLQGLGYAVLGSVIGFIPVYWWAGKRGF